MGQTATTESLFDVESVITLPVHVVVLNNYKFSGNIDIKASQSPNYTIRHLLQTTIKTLQQIHQPTTYHVHYISFNIKQSHSEYSEFNHKKNHIESQLYYSKDTKQFSQILKSKIMNKESFKFHFLTECDVEIPINVTCLFNPKYNMNNFKLSIWYNNNHFIRDILNDIIFYINSKYKHDAHITYNNVQIINEESFCKNSQKNYPITHYKNIHKMHNIGINIQLISKQITCPYIMGKQNEICPIYLQMTLNKKFTIENYKHLFIFNHFEDRFMWTQDLCINSSNCQSYIRLKNNGNKLEDKCHLKLYKHPIIKLGKRYEIFKENVSDFFLQKHNDNYNPNNILYFPVYLPSFGDEEEYDLSCSDNEINGYLQPLITEIINNGFKNDLYLNNNINDGNNNKNEIYPIMEYIDEKLDLFQNENMNSNEKTDLNKGEMLALILYLNGQCMEDLSSTQLNGNYLKWKWFDRCLYDAIDILSKSQYGSYKIYFSSSPINYIFNELHSEKTLLNPNIDININKQYKNKCFKTYCIGSKYKQVQLYTMNELDVLIKINKSFKSVANKCCDISWISQFPDQYEMIMQRSTSNKDTNAYKYKCQMTKDGIQTVSIYQ